ncbi:MAG: hypothetical protein L6Q71_03115 [Planctomycetes bacterium]|nr:hypothetical protein [Planctomycetota bacterium]NUQ33945.1 hypothetical protein [Planctomycetaceae bacterium]
MQRYCFIFVLLLAACSATGGGATTRPSPVGEPVMLNVAAKAGDRVRTRRELSVTEIDMTGQKLLVKLDESFATEVLDVDAAGNPMRVSRAYERSFRSLQHAGGEEKNEHGALEGCSFELTQLADGVTIKLLSGTAKPEDYGDLLIQGFDTVIVPRGPARKGDAWEIDINGNPYFRGLLKLAGLEAERNVLRAELFDVSGDIARISLRWRVSGTLESGVPMVFELAGELRVDSAQRLVTEVTLSGGKTDSSGRPLQQIAMKLNREHVSGWYR